MRAVVTGGSGFLGRYLLARLTQDGWQTTVLARKQTGRLDVPEAVVGPLPWSVERLAEILRATQADVVFHLLGASDAVASTEVYEVNLLTTVRLLEAMKLLSTPPAALLCGSAAEYGVVQPKDLPVSETHPCRPFTVYGISKYAQTLHALSRANAGLRVVVARIFNPIGPGMGGHLALASFARQIARARGMDFTLMVGNLDVTRDYIEAAEVARLLIALASLPSAYGGVYNICTGVETRLRDLVGMMIQTSGPRVRTKVDPTRLRAHDINTFYGSAQQLTKLGLNVARPDFEGILQAMVKYEENALCVRNP